MRRLLLLIAGVMLAAPAAGRAEGQADLWRKLADGSHLALMRHAEAPGTGDPAAFRLDDCATQRNLDEAGREQARRTGELFRANGVLRARVFTSQWCRCRDTAALLALGPVEPLPSLNSFFDARERAAAQTAETLAFLATLPDGPPVVLVTHQVNITALTDIVPRSGEIVVTRLTASGDLSVAGRLGPVD